MAEINHIYELYEKVGHKEFKNAKVFKEAREGYIGVVRAGGKVDFEKNGI